MTLFPFIVLLISVLFIVTLSPCEGKGMWGARKKRDYEERSQSINGFESAQARVKARDAREAFLNEQRRHQRIQKEVDEVNAMHGNIQGNSKGNSDKKDKDNRGVKDDKGDRSRDKKYRKQFTQFVDNDNVEDAVSIDMKVNEMEKLIDKLLSSVIDALATPNESLDAFLDPDRIREFVRTSFPESVREEYLKMLNSMFAENGITNRMTFQIVFKKAIIELQASRDMIASSLLHQYREFLENPELLRNQLSQLELPEEWMTMTESLLNGKIPESIDDLLLHLNEQQRKQVAKFLSNPGLHLDNTDKDENSVLDVDLEDVQRVSELVDETLSAMFMDEDKLEKFRQELLNNHELKQLMELTEGEIEDSQQWSERLSSILADLIPTAADDGETLIELDGDKTKQ